jgi:D-glycero-D-manno-heptose 1,7-bisphosphate phosphatase
MSSEKRKAIFLDRDGVLIRERGDYTWLLEDMIVNPGVADSLQRYAAAGYLLIVISNQAGIAKGIYEKKDADYLHLHLSRHFALKGITIGEYYYCPHFPSFSKCLCRKPDSLLLEKAIARFQIDPAKSYFIGDTDRDMEAGVKAGVNVIRIEPNAPLPELT